MKFNKLHKIPESSIRRTRRHMYIQQPPGWLNIPQIKKTSPDIYDCVHDWRSITPSIYRLCVRTTWNLAFVFLQCIVQGLNTATKAHCIFAPKAQSAIFGTY